MNFLIKLDVKRQYFSLFVIYIYYKKTIKHYYYNYYYHYYYYSWYFYYWFTWDLRSSEDLARLLLWSLPPFLWGLELGLLPEYVGMGRFEPPGLDAPFLFITGFSLCLEQGCFRCTFLRNLEILCMQLRRKLFIFIEIIIIIFDKTEVMLGGDGERWTIYELS